MLRSFWQAFARFCCYVLDETRLLTYGDSWLPKCVSDMINATVIRVRDYALAPFIPNPNDSRDRGPVFPGFFPKLFCGREGYFHDTVIAETKPLSPSFTSPAREPDGLHFSAAGGSFMGLCNRSVPTGNIIGPVHRRRAAVRRPA